MKRCTLLGITGFVFLVSAAFAYGQGFTGPESSQALMLSQTITVNEAKNLPHDSWVILNGNIVNSLPGGKHYTFRDSLPQGGEITVDIGPKEWRGLSVGVSDTIEIYGEVKTKRGQVSIKVHAISRSAVQPISINEALSLPHDSWVVVTGTITNRLPGKHDYTFRDSSAQSGEITVDIGPKEWRGLSVGVSDIIEISGEIKSRKGHIFLKVHALRKI